MNPKPRKIGGIKVQPQWNWTREYAAEFARMMRETGRWHDLGVVTLHPDMQYRRWLASRDGLGDPNHPAISTVIERQRQIMASPIQEDAE